MKTVAKFLAFNEAEMSDIHQINNPRQVPVASRVATAGGQH